MAHKKAGGSTSLGRDSQPQYLGIKKNDGQFIHSGGIIVRQRGTAIRAGVNVKRAGDDTLFAVADGIVSFQNKKRLRFDGTMKWVKVANVKPKKVAMTAS